MKKLVLLLLLFSFLGTPVFAEEITVTDEFEAEELESSDYIPNIVTESLKDAKIEEDNDKTVKSLLGFATEALKSIFKEYSGNIAVLLEIMIFSSVFYKFIDNKCFKTITNYIISLIFLTEIFKIIQRITASLLEALSSLYEIMNAVLPSFSAILLFGGNSFTSIAESASFTAVLALLNLVIKFLLLPAVSLLMLLLTFERLSPQLSEMNLLGFFKKNILTVISFITMLLLTVISYQHIISAGKDSVSGKAVKFAAANFIPIVGSAVGESLKTVGAGLKYLKTTVGGAVMLSVVITVLPVLLQIFLIKMYFNFLSVAAGAMGCKSEQGVLGESVSILNILNAIIICVMVLSILLIVTFILSASSLS